MNKDLVIEFGIKVAAKELSIEPIEYGIDQKGILIEKGLAGLYNPEEKIIVISDDWLGEANNNDILLVVFHEMRHYYQKLQIDKFQKNLKTDIEYHILKRWNNEFYGYKNPYKNDLNTYSQQLIEVDSRKFSKSLVNKIINLIE